MGLEVTVKYKHKFRGKRADTGEWIFGNVITNRCLGHNCRHDYLAIQDQGNDLYMFRVVPDSIGQWTHKTDKDGIELYELDIIEKTIKDGFSDILCVVWNSDDYGYKLKDKFGNLYDITKDLEFKIIGNLFENPELMEAE